MTYENDELNNYGLSSDTTSKNNYRLVVLGIRLIFSLLILLYLYILFFYIINNLMSK